MRLPTVIVATTVAASAAAAAAAGLPASAVSVAAGDTGVVACDTDGLTIAVATTAGKVTAVTVGGIADPACEGGRLSVSLTSSGTRVGSGGPVTVPTDADTADNEVTVTIGEQPAPDGIDATRVLIGGP